MSNRNDVIDALTYLISEDCTENQFDYMDVIQEAIDLLLEQDNQEPVEPSWDKDGKAFCGNCFENVGGIFGPSIKCVVRLKYCPECGKRVDWDA